MIHYLPPQSRSGELTGVVRCWAPVAGVLSLESLCVSRRTRSFCLRVEICVHLAGARTQSTEITQ